MPTPLSTYRLQLRAEFGFADAAAVVPYLADLGVSHVYCSPILQAAPGSTHGYDVVDHSRISADLGGEQGWQQLVAACRAHGLGIVVDVVPNHMAVHERNLQLWDVLALGRASSYATWFDVDWDAQDGRLLMPVLGEPLDEAPLQHDGDMVRYYDHSYPASEAMRLAYWRVANEELNYRRFFDVTDLIGVRVEDPAVFAATHDVLTAKVATGEIDGLRIDHPDGLARPGGYLDDLAAAALGAWVVVEKILEAGEQLPPSWACAGTTGYDALNAIDGVLTHQGGETALTALWTSLTGEPAEFAVVVDAAKRLVTDRILAAELARLARVIRADSPGADLTMRGLIEALTEVLVAFDVYRDYDAGAHLTAACTAAIAARPDRAREIEAVRAAAQDLGSEAATRLQQTAGPVMAKGVEDTSFYRWFRLAALNEVGGDPGRFGLRVADFHAFCARLASDWPATMTTLSTHDTKRSEDMRARLLVLAEIPDVWGRAVTGWRSRRTFHRDPALEYLFWQTLVGCWPIDAERMRAYLEKASREAKTHTSWTDPDEDYDSALRSFVDDVYGDGELMAEVGDFVASQLLAPGHANALSQKLLSLTMPGVPDVYQGCEAESLAVVDPDNRRPVDYQHRRRLLDEPDASFDATKLQLTAAVLRLRREHPDWFVGGSYAPLEAGLHAVAFVRAGQAVVIAGLHPVTRASDHSEAGGAGPTVELPPGAWRHILREGAPLSGQATVADLLGAAGVALLVRST